MERSIRLNESMDPITGYDLERQLQVAERRYAEARAVTDKAREELRSLSTTRGVGAHHLALARRKFETVAARCSRLRTIIENLEEQLDV